MGALRNIALAVLLISFITFVALFGRLPALRNTPIATLHRVLWIHIPAALQLVDRRLTGGRCQRSVSKLGHYLVYEKNPVVLVIFLGLLTGSALLFLAGAWPYLPLYHHIIIILLLPQPYAFTYLCASSKKSEINVTNHAQHMRTYPYDHTLYYPGRYCSTCHHLKPPRSKHCSICRACIARHDHHCVWVNNCLGHDNYSWFIALLASLGTLLPYGAALGYMTLRAISAPSLIGNTTKGFSGFFDRCGIMLMADARIGSVGLLAGLTAPLAWGLLAYHIYLLWVGATTNETVKWSELKEDMADGLVYKTVRQPYDSAQRPKDQEPQTFWPTPSSQLIIRIDDKETPKQAAQEMGYLGPADSPAFEQCWTYGDIVNVYDLGFRRNMLDAFNLLPH